MLNILCYILPLMLYAGSYSKGSLAVAEEPVTVLELYDDVVVMLQGDRAPMRTESAEVDVEVANGVMRLRAKREAARSKNTPTVHWHRRDHFNRIQEIRVHDRAHLHAESIHAPLVLAHTGSGSVVLKGRIPLVFLEQKGRGSLVVSGIASQETDMRFFGGEARLEGRVDRLRYQAFKKAMVDAKALDVSVLWAVGEDASLSLLHPLKETHVVVGGQAQIVLEKKTPYQSLLYDRQGTVVYNNPFASHPQ